MRSESCSHGSHGNRTFPSLLPQALISLRTGEEASNTEAPRVSVVTIGILDDSDSGNHGNYEQSFEIFIPPVVKATSPYSHFECL